MLWSSYHQKRPSSYKTVLIVHSLSTTAPGEKGTFLALGTNCPSVLWVLSITVIKVAGGPVRSTLDLCLIHERKTTATRLTYKLDQITEWLIKKGTSKIFEKMPNKLRKLSSLGCRKKLAQISPPINWIRAMVCCGQVLVGFCMSGSFGFFWHHCVNSSCEWHGWPLPFSDLEWGQEQSTLSSGSTFLRLVYTSPLYYHSLYGE